MTASGPAADPAPEFPCPKIHCALLCWSVLPLFIRVDPNVNVIVTASLAVLTGSWRSVKPAAVPLEDRMSKQVGAQIPLRARSLGPGLYEVLACSVYRHWLTLSKGLAAPGSQRLCTALVGPTPATPSGSDAQPWSPGPAQPTLHGRSMCCRMPSACQLSEARCSSACS